MRLDKFLKVSRVIKRRTVANDACDNQHVKVNDRPAKASYEVKENDVIEITFGQRTLKIRDNVRGDRLTAASVHIIAFFFINWDEKSISKYLCKEKGRQRNDALSEL